MKIFKYIFTVFLTCLILPANASKGLKYAPVHKNKIIKPVTANKIINKTAIKENKVASKPETYNMFQQHLDIFNCINFNELKELSQNNKPQGELFNKVGYVLNNAAVDNSISDISNYEYKNDEKIGNYIRVASWNIQRGFNLNQIKQSFADPESLFSTLVNPEKGILKSAEAQQQILKDSDIIILNEVDAGMPRTGYINVVKELASSLKYNYAYGVEFLEVDPVHLGLEDYKWSEERFLYPNIKKIEINEEKYKGLHGSAILSRFPLENVRIIRLPKVYDWYNGEKGRISDLEDVKRGAANVVFDEEMFREIRIGGRMAIAADIKTPGLDTPVTIIATHFENRCIPKFREQQLRYLLQYMYNIRNPIVLAGDFNTTGRDGSPTGIRKELKKRLKDPEFLARTAISVAVPYASIANAVAQVTNIARTHTDPTVKNIPILAVNREREFFDIIRKEKFEDGHCFDIRGISDKTSNYREGLLADSNERDFKGFKPTFIFKRPLVIGKYKLDWFFVKAYLNEQNSPKGSYKLAPHYGRTLFDLNYIFPVPISDHAPVTVDLPINEPAALLDK